MTSLEAWEPPTSFERAQDPNAQAKHVIQTAEAYRWAAMLYLYRSVPELPCFCPTELAKKTLSYLATIPLTSRTIIRHIFPLMVAGSEARTSEEREWVRNRWHGMNLRMRIDAIDQCERITEEAWRRKDVYELEKTRTLATAAALKSPNPLGGGNSPSNTYHQSTEMIPGRKRAIYDIHDGDNEPLDSGNNCDNREECSERSRPASLSDLPPPTIGDMDPAYSSRGHLHYLCIMREWRCGGELAIATSKDRC